MQITTKSAPSMSMEFLYFLMEKLTETLIERLKLRGDKVGVKMLECLTILLMYPQKVKGGQVLGMDDENIVAIVGEISYLLKDWS